MAIYTKNLSTTAKYVENYSRVTPGYYIDGNYQPSSSTGSVTVGNGIKEGKGQWTEQVTDAGATPTTTYQGKSAIWVRLYDIPLTSKNYVSDFSIYIKAGYIWKDKLAAQTSGTISYSILGTNDDNSSSLNKSNYNDVVTGTTLVSTTSATIQTNVDYKIPISVDIAKSAILTYRYLLIKLDGTSLPNYVSGHVESASVTYDDGAPRATTSYPVNVPVVNSKRVTFSWDYSCGSPELVQTKYKIEIKNGDTVVKTDTVTSANYYYELTDDMREHTGESAWRVTVYNNIGSYTTDWSAFTFVGKTAVPEITSVSMDAKPTITWTAVSQTAYEMRIISNTTGLTVFQTGLIKTTDKTVTLTKMFAEDNYSITMRVLNEYGYYTDWNSYNWVLVYTSVPTTPETPVVNVINGHFVQIISFNSLTSGDDKYWVVRVDESGNETILAVHNDNNTIDTKCALNKVYYYKLRHFNENTSGFADSESIISYVEAEGAIVNTVGTNPRAFHLWSNDSDDIFEISKDNTTEKVFHWTIGRAYPIMETSNWKTIQRGLKAHVTKSEFNELLDIMSSGESVYYRADGESFLASMEMSYASEYVGGGVIAKFTFTQIDEDEESVE